MVKIVSAELAGLSGKLRAIIESQRRVLGTHLAQCAARAGITIVVIGELNMRDRQVRIDLSFVNGVGSREDGVDVGDGIG